MEMLESSLFIKGRGWLKENVFYRIFRDFLGFSTEMFYTCFTLWPKCFTVLADTDRIKERMTINMNDICIRQE